MRGGRRRLFTESECAELWHMYKVGESVLAIGRALGRGGSAVRRVLEATGGIAPTIRQRSSRVLSFVEREEIARGLAAGQSMRAIAKELNRAPSRVSQEVGRHGGRGRYRAAEADLAAWDWARRPKLCLLFKNLQLQRLVAGKLKEDWAPQRSQAGSKPNTLRTRSCGCRTRQSIEACSCRLAGR